MRQAQLGRRPRGSREEPGTGPWSFCFIKSDNGLWLALYTLPQMTAWSLEACKSTEPESLVCCQDVSLGAEAGPGVLGSPSQFPVPFWGLVGPLIPGVLGREAATPAHVLLLLRALAYVRAKAGASSTSSSPSTVLATTEALGFPRQRISPTCCLWAKEGAAGGPTGVSWSQEAPLSPGPGYA